MIEAGNADEALRLLADISDIRVVFTDVEMPGSLNGFELAELVEARWPEIGVVVTSGRRLPNEASPLVGKMLRAQTIRRRQGRRADRNFVYAHH